SAQNNQLSELDITNLSLIERVDAHYNSNITLITGANGNPTLTSLNLSGNGLGNFNGAAYPNLEWLSLNNNGLSNFNGNNNLNLQNLFLNNNNISKLVLSGNAQLSQLQVMSNGLQELDLRNGNNAALTTLSATGNLLTCISVDAPEDETMPYAGWELDLGVVLSVNCKQAEEVVLIPDANFEQTLIDLGFDTNGNGQISGNILVSEAEALINLDVSGRNITDATGLEAFVNLETLNFSNNALTNIDLSGNSALVNLDVSGNGLVELLIPDPKNLIELNAENNQLSALNFEDLSNIEILDVSGNLLESLNFSDFRYLSNLDVSSNLLSSLDLRNGANADILAMNAEDNNLICIGVDDSANIPDNWSKDLITEYTDSGDCEAPTVLVQNITVMLDRYGMVEISAGDVDGGSFDNTTDQKNLSYSLSTSIFDCSSLGTNEVELTVSDESGNEASAFVTVIVEDEIAPEASALRSITLDLEGATSIDLLPEDVNNGSTDNCNSVLTYSLSQANFSFPGTYTVIFSVEDSSGNIDSAEVDVEVIDSSREPTSLKFKQNLVATIYPVPFTIDDNLYISFSKTIDLNQVQVNVYSMDPRLLGSVDFVVEGDRLVSYNAKFLDAAAYMLEITVKGETKGTMIIKN
ncbi:MAG TPA: hypothetical protein VJ973_07990, partial [Christiangramia sp.]|nr:hypothetical protein [Christiangramia sp.]